MMSPHEELIWLAGLMEGEGSFMLSTSSVQGRRYQHARMTVGMSDKDVVEHVARLFGTSVYAYTPKKPPHKVIYSAQVNGLKARWFMERLLPYMGERRAAKIREVLEENKPAYRRNIKPWEFFNVINGAA